MTDEQLQAHLLGQLRVRVRRLADSAEEQAAYVTGLNVAPSVDELALEFDDFYRPAISALAADSRMSEVVTRLKELDRALESVSEWRVEDLGTAEWGEIRRLASEALREWPD